MKYRLPVLLLSTLVLGAWPMALQTAMAAQTAKDDPLAEFFVGQWAGQGVYDGNVLQLSRVWSLDLNGQFLVGDMGVEMPNGASFRSLSYWKPEGDGVYSVVMLDEIGRVANRQALRESGTGDVVMHMVDDLADDGPAWRRTVYRFTGRDTYEELLYGVTPDGWTRLARFAFTRSRANE